jgi:hypothetical protein
MEVKEVRIFTEIKLLQKEGQMEEMVVVEVTLF